MPEENHKTDAELPDCIKMRLTFDAARMKDEMERMTGEDWIAHFVTQNYEGDWSVIPLRGKKGAEHPVMMIYSDPTCTEFEDTPFLPKDSYFSEVLDTFECPLQAVRLMRLGPGSHIKEHCDHDLSFEDGSVRLHIPVSTNEGVDFRLNRRSLKLEEGGCWYLRLSDPHEVHNAGSSDRVHLVIDAKVNDWLTHELRNGASTNAPGSVG